MRTESVQTRLLMVIELLLLVATALAAVLLHFPGEWHPASLVVLLALLALLGERFSVEVQDGQLSASTIAIVLAMGLLGPAPAAMCGVAAMILRSVTGHLGLARWLNNLAAFAVVPFAGGLAIHYLGKALVPHASHSGNVIVGLIVFGVFTLTLAVNFVVVGLVPLIEERRSLRRQLPDFLPLLPGELAAGALATILVIAYKSAGLPMLIGAIALLLVFQRLTAALVRSEARAERLQARSRQLVGLQLGVLRTLVRALGMRDETTGRHAAAVASYGSALAHALGCSEDERDIVRSAGLLHEIGKFTWPDRVLHAEHVADEDLEIVKSHPQEGAILVGALDGYGPVADAILYHRERMDGRGYPAGLIGQEIPLTSRILAVCSTYDTMTSRGGYRGSMTPEEGMEELNVAARNGQLDPDIVAVFIDLLKREGASFAEEANFETDLEFERRVQDIADVPSSLPGLKTTLHLPGRKRRAGINA